MDTVVKHGSHNQKDHGRGKGGGTLRNQDEPMNPETAWVHSTTWYHGTSRPDLVTLDASQAPSRYPGMGSSYSLMAHNFATNDRELAAQYARDAVDMDMKNGITGARAVVYEVKPTSDYFDPDPHSGPGGWNDGPEDMSVARELVDGGGGVSIRFHDEMDIVGAFDADTGEPITVQKMAEMVKHGSHNQASHNPHKGGTKDLPEGWSERSREAVRERQMSRFSQHYEDPSRVQEIADRVTDRTREFDGPNGTVVRVQFSDAAQQVDPAKMNEALGAIDTVQKLNPVKDLVVHFGDQPFRDEAAIIDGGALGFVIRGEKTINMRPGLVEKGVVTERPDSGHFMPSYESASPLTYYITHEYGHVLDRRSSGQQDDYALFQSGAINSVSEYGRTNGAETWAESYTEWALTGGRTSNPASQYFADKYFWADNLSEAAVKAVGERTIIVDTFSVSKDPEIITTVTKAVYVAFEPGLRPVLKHGSHDQSSHGRRGGGGSSLTLDAGVAQSIVERVRANGGLSVSMVDGSEPTEGFMVAKGGKQSAIVDADEFYDPVKGPEAMSSFLKGNRELGEGAYLGLWHNQADGKVYLDVSENIMDRATAIAAGRDRDQISIWDVANFEEIDTGGTGKVGKAVAGSETAGPVQDDRRGDRRVRKDSVGEVRGGGVVVAFEPGLRPVLKHGSHDQSSHGRRGGGSRLTPGDTGPAAEAYRRRELADVPGRYSPPGTETFPERKSPPPVGRREGGQTWIEEYAEQRDAIADALVNGNFDDLDIPPSRLAQRIGQAQGEVLRRVDRVARRVGLKREKRWQYTAEEAESLRESYYEKYGRPGWMDKAAGLSKHLGSAHDQKTHGRGGGGGKGWGDRQKDIDAMANVGPSRDVLERGVAGGMDDDELRARVREDYGDVIEEEARMAVADEMAAEGWVDRSDEPDYEEPLMGKTYQEEFDERLEARIESDLDYYVRDYGDDIRQADLDGLDADSFNEVFGVYHMGETPDGRMIELQAAVESVQVERGWGESYVDVRGTIYDQNGNWAGEFHRRFINDDNGNLAVSHELLQLDDDYQGSGFSKVFNRQAEDYYISHGITDIHVHAALGVGGFAWARQGFDWARNGGATWQVKDGMDSVLESGLLPSSVERSGRSLRARLDLPTSDPDYPTPREVASWGYVRGADMWPGKESLLGSDWYGIKELSPDGPRRSTTETQSVATTGSEPQIPGQQTLFD